MQLGQFQLQILGSLLVILGTAVVALICDFLMRKNDELRALTAELKVRHEEELRRAYQIAGHAPPVGKEKKRPANPEALAVMERGAALAGSGNRLPSASVVARKRNWGSLLNSNAQASKAAPKP